MPPMLISQAAAQPLSGTSASKPAPSVPPSAEAMTAATVSVPPTYNAITVQLQPVAKAAGWLDPIILGPLVSAIAILATYIGTARNTNKQLKAARETADRQMQNTRDQARLDRTLQSRKTVFDTFIDDFKRAAHLIGSLPNHELEKSGPDIDELSAMNATVNKLWLWAEVATVVEVRSIQADVNVLFLDAMMECQPIWQTQKHIKRIEARLAELEEQRDGQTVWLRNFFEEHGRTVDPPQRIEGSWRIGQEQLAGTEAKIRTGHEQLKQALAEEARLRQVFMAFIGARQPPLMDRMTRLMGMARSELQVEGDTAILDTQTQEMKKRMSEAIQRLHDRLKE